MEADDQAIQTILLGLPEDIYAAVDSCETAQEIWLRVQQMMKGSDIGIQEKKAKLFNEWERFTSTDRESIESYYHHFSILRMILEKQRLSERLLVILKFLKQLYNQNGVGRHHNKPENFIKPRESGDCSTGYEQGQDRQMRMVEQWFVKMAVQNQGVRMFGTQNGQTCCSRIIIRIQNRKEIVVAARVRQGEGMCLSPDSVVVLLKRKMKESNSRLKDKIDIGYSDWQAPFYDSDGSVRGLVIDKVLTNAGHTKGTEVRLLCCRFKGKKSYPNLFMVRRLGLLQAYDRESKASLFRISFGKFFGKPLSLGNDIVAANLGFRFCDSDLEVAFRRNSCFVRNLDGVDLLKGNRSTNLYTINLHEMASASPICLMARATSTKSCKEKAKGAVLPTKPVPNSKRRTPQQNGVVERRNRTLVEAARTMLIFSRAPLFLWTRSDLCSVTITTLKPTEGDLVDLLFEAMFDDFMWSTVSAPETASAAQVLKFLQTPTGITTTVAQHDKFIASSQATDLPNTSQDVDELEIQQHVQHQPATIAENVPNAMFDANTINGKHCGTLRMSKRLYDDPDGFESMRGVLQFNRLDDGSYQDIFGICCTQIVHCISNGCENCFLAWFAKRDVLVRRVQPTVSAMLVIHAMSKVIKEAQYGFKQAPRAWYNELSKVYVDDIIFGSTNPRILVLNFNGFVDADYAGCKDTFKSTSGEYVTLSVLLLPKSPVDADTVNGLWLSLQQDSNLL
ncbi:retrovirus-related pol polyprotein from transposon TNT 1-94 [Tanacetum coccineum]